MNLVLFDPKSRQSYPLLQTPTEVTKEILGKKDRYQAYVRWVRESREWNWKSPNEVALYKGLKQELKRWLEAHPNHEWSII
jgi:hypothetical protein